MINNHARTRRFQFFPFFLSQLQKLGKHNLNRGVSNPISRRNTHLSACVRHFCVVEHHQTANDNCKTHPKPAVDEIQTHLAYELSRRTVAGKQKQQQLASH
jgi:hypothetical protein